MSASPPAAGPEGSVSRASTAPSQAELRPCVISRRSSVEPSSGASQPSTSTVPRSCRISGGGERNCQHLDCAQILPYQWERGRETVSTSTVPRSCRISGRGERNCQHLDCAQILPYQRERGGERSAPRLCPDPAVSVGEGEQLSAPRLYPDPAVSAGEGRETVNTSTVPRSCRISGRGERNCQHLDCTQILPYQWERGEELSAPRLCPDPAVSVGEGRGKVSTGGWSARWFICGEWQNFYRRSCFL